MAAGDADTASKGPPVEGQAAAVPAAAVAAVDAGHDAGLNDAAARARRAWHRLGLRVQSTTPNGLMQFLLAVGAIAVVGWVLWRALEVLTPFIVGLFVGYLLLPLIKRLEQHLPRRWSSLIICVVSLLLFVAVPVLLVPAVLRQLVALVRALPSPDEVSAMLNGLLAQVTALPVEVQNVIRQLVDQAAASLRANAEDLLLGALSFVGATFLGIINAIALFVGFLVVPIFLFWFLKDEPHGVRNVDRALPHWLRADFWAVLRIIDRTFSRYLRGQLLLSLMVGTSVFIGLTLLQLLGFSGVRYTLLLAIFAAITELIPYIGPLLGAIPGVALGLFDSWETTLAMVVVYTAVQQLENQIFVPRITGEAVNLHPAVLMVALIAMSTFGLLGVIVAAPLIAVLRDLFLYVYGRFDDPPRPAGLLPGETPGQESTRAPPEATPAYQPGDGVAP